MRNLLGKLFGGRQSAAGDNHPIQLAAFGKHPAWDDHIDDLGLDTHLLISVKDLLYLRGIAMQIDQGAWEELEPSRRIDHFNHALILDLRTDVVMGRLWTSEDGKRRTRYPMVLLAHAQPLSHSMMEFVDGVLERLSWECRAAETAEQVRAVIREAAVRLNAGPGESDGAAGEWTPPSDVELARVLHELATRFSGFSPEGWAARSRNSSPVACSVRVPVARSDCQHVAFWIQLMKGRFHPDVPLLFLHARAERWVDIVVGPATPKDFFCLKAGLGAIPLTTQIPYETPESTMREAAEAIRAWSASPDVTAE